MLRRGDKKIGVPSYWQAEDKRYRYGADALNGSLLQDLLHPAHLAVLKPHFDAMGVKRGAGEDGLYDPSRSLSAALVLLQDNLHLQAWPDIGTVHTALCGHQALILSDPIYQAFGRNDIQERSSAFKGNLYKERGAARSLRRACPQPMKV